MPRRGDRPAGDEQSRLLCELVHREHHGLILSVAGRYVGAAHAEDVASRVYEKLLHGKLPDPGRPLVPWLRQVVRNQAIDQLRALRAHEPLDAGDETIAAADGDLADGIVDRIVVRDALARLAPIERDAVLAAVVGSSPAEVARAHGRTTHAVHMLATRARKQLRALLEPAMLPVGALLAWLRRTLHRVEQPTFQYALDAVVIAAFALGVGIQIGDGPTASDLGDDALFEGTRIATTLSASAPGGGSPPSTSRAANGGGDLPPPAPAPLIEMERRKGAAAPRYLVIRYPRVDTPAGPVENETRVECDSPGFSRIPSTDPLYRGC